jgi:HEAT repeat protein
MAELKTLGRKPTMGEVIQYYSRTDVLSFIYEAAKKKKVTFVCEFTSHAGPEDKRHLLLQPHSLQHLKETILTSIQKKAPSRDENYRPQFYPFFNQERNRGFGSDYSLETDVGDWYECFQWLQPVIALFDSFGVYYRLKFSGHRSLHLTIPSETFPECSHGKLAEEQISHIDALHQAVSNSIGGKEIEHPPCLRLAYGLNELTGLVSLPIIKGELSHFRPWHASIYLTKIEPKWSEIPFDAKEKLACFLEAAMKDENLGVSSVSFCETGLTFQKERSKRFSFEPIENPQKHLNSDNPLLREAGMWQLMVDDKDVPFPLLEKGLQDSHSNVRWFASEIVKKMLCQVRLRQTGLTSENLSLIAQLIKDSDQYVRVNAKEAAINVRIPTLLELFMASKDEQMRENTAVLLRELCSCDLLSIYSKLQTQKRLPTGNLNTDKATLYLELLAAESRENLPLSRQFTDEIIKFGEDAVPALVASLVDWRSGLRDANLPAELLKEMNADVTSDLIAMIKSTSCTVRERAVKALTICGDEAAINVFAGILQNKYGYCSSSVTVAAIEGLSKIGTTEAIAYVVEALGDFHTVRGQAVNALKGMDNEQITDVLLNELDNPNWNVKMAILDILEDRNHSKVINALKRFLADPSTIVRSKVFAILKRAKQKSYDLLTDVNNQPLSF